MQIPFGKGSTTKDTIVQILSEEWPLTVKQIYDRVKKKSDKAITYQAVHKTVLLLLGEGVLQKDAHGFSLNLDWIRKTKQKSELLEECYLKRQKLFSKKLKEKETVNLHFSNTMDMVRFVLFDFFTIEDPKKRSIVCKLWNAWPPIVLNDNEFKALSQILSKNKFYQTITNTTFLDKQSADCLGKMGAKTKFGVPCDLAADTLVVGDFVATVYFPEVKKQFRKILKLIKILNGPALKLLFQFLFTTKVNILVTITNNAELADGIRKEILALFKGA